MEGVSNFDAQRINNEEASPRAISAGSAIDEEHLEVWVGETGFLG